MPWNIEYLFQRLKITGVVNGWMHLTSCLICIKNQTNCLIPLTYKTTDFQMAVFFPNSPTPTSHMFCYSCCMDGHMVMSSNKFRREKTLNRFSVGEVMAITEVSCPDNSHVNTCTRVRRTISTRLGQDSLLQEGNRYLRFPDTRTPARLQWPAQSTQSAGISNTETTDMYVHVLLTEHEINIVLSGHYGFDCTSRQRFHFFFCLLREILHSIH